MNDGTTGGGALFIDWGENGEADTTNIVIVDSCEFHSNAAA